MILLAETAIVAFVVSLLLTPIVRKLAIRWNIVDRPDKHRKLHEGSTPLGGGVAVLISTIIAILAVMFVADGESLKSASNTSFLIGVCISAVLLCLVGLVDDRFGLRGRQKLFGQVLAAGLLLVFGLKIEQVEVFGTTFELGVLAIPLTMFWLLGAINAVNLLDGMDGLATSVGIVLSIAVAIMASVTGHTTEAFLALALAGSLLGFLVYNSPPATIFLGDAGSMIIGLVLGALAIRGSLKGPASVVLAAPTAIWAIPIFDVAMAILRRRLTGRSIYATDRGHLHHTLQQRGFSDRKVVLVIGAFCSLTAIGATLSVYNHNEYLAYGVMACVFALLVVTRLFGHHECVLLVKRLKGLTRSLIPSFSSTENRSGENIQTRLRGHRQWEDLWETLTNYGDRFDLQAIQLNVSLPRIGEEFHANWRQPNSGADESELFHANIPLHAHGMVVGRLRIAGIAGVTDIFEGIGELIAGLTPVEMHLCDLLDNCEQEESPEAQVAELVGESFTATQTS